MSKANERQIGGNHYRTGKKQHWDYMIEARVPYLTGIATKYIVRNKADRLQDYMKAAHCIDKMIETTHMGKPCILTTMSDEEFLEFTDDLNLDKDRSRVCYLLLIATQHDILKALDNARLELQDMIDDLECDAGPGYTNQDR